MDNNIYDLVIVGAGPSGLALAQCCSKLNLKILVIDREASIGGCHRVRRVYVPEVNEYLFTEHGPRIINDSYVVFMSLLKEMNMSFDDIFTKYNFNITEIGKKTIFTTLSIYEQIILFIQYIYLLFNENYGNNISLITFLNENNFNTESIELINRTCILTDGGDASKFTLNEFLELFNQNATNTLYQPNKPNDIGLFKIWKNYLEKQNVKFLLNTNISSINTNGNKIESLNINSTKIYAKNFVFAIPPESLNDIIKSNNIPIQGNLEVFAKDTKYYDYISFTFHWDTILNLKNVYGFPLSDWGIAFIKLSDYSHFEELNSKTVISIALTRSEYKSKRLNKTANECTFEEIVQEIYLELKNVYGDSFIYPKIALLSPGVKYNNDLKKWISKDTAFINSSKTHYLDFKNEYIENMYNCGTQNGKSLYKFTSLESAVTNGVYLSKILYPELNNDSYIKITRASTLRDIVIKFLNSLICIIFVIFVIYAIYNKKNIK